MVVHVAATNVQVFCTSATDHTNGVYYAPIGKPNSDHTVEQKQNMNFLLAPTVYAIGMAQ